jgi:hypothetical protein
VPKPLKPYDDRVADVSRDFAATGSFSLYALERMLQDCADQPLWRLRAKLCAAYYDGKQLDALRKQLLIAEGLDERIVNLIRPIVNSVLGQEARSRTDVRIDFDDDGMADVAEVISAEAQGAGARDLCPRRGEQRLRLDGEEGPGLAARVPQRRPAGLPVPLRVPSTPTRSGGTGAAWASAPGSTTGCAGWPHAHDRPRRTEAAMPQFKDILARSSDGWAGWRTDAQPAAGRARRHSDHRGLRERTALQRQLPQVGLVRHRPPHGQGRGGVVPGAGHRRVHGVSPDQAVLFDPRTRATWRP